MTGVNGIKKVSSILLQETEKKQTGKVVLKANTQQERRADAVIVAYGFDANPPSWLIDSGVVSNASGVYLGCAPKWFDWRCANQ